MPGSGLVLYDDARAPGWADWSTAITPTWDSPAPVLAGTQAVRVQVNAPYGTLTLRGQSSVNTQPFDALSFWVYGGPDGNSLAAFVQSGDASPPSRFVFFTAEPNTWRFVRIRLGAFGDFAQIKRVNIQDISGQSGGSFSVDQIALLPQQVAGTTGDAIVYDDALAATWQSWSYGISANFASTSVVQSGAKAIAVQISQTWGTLGLRNAVALDATPYDAVQFDVYGDGSQGPLVVFLQEGDATQPSNYIFFSPPQGTWTHIKIPLGLFGFVTQIKRISIQDASGSTGARFFVDNLRLSVPSVPAAIAHAQHANRTAVDGLLVMALNARVTHAGNALSWRLQGADANNVRVYRSATDDWSVAQLVATSAAIGQWQDTAANRNATYWLKATLANGSEIGMGPIHPEAAVFVSGSKVFLPVVLR